MKNINTLLALIALFTLSGCTITSNNSEKSSLESVVSEELSESTESSEPSEESSESESESEVVIPYENQIEKPSNIVHTMDELMAICDYYAFYKIADFKVQIADDFEFKTEQKTVKSEINYLYWNSELINGTMGITGTDNGNGTWSIHYVLYENAVVSTTPTKKLLNDLFYDAPTSSLGTLTFATDDENKPVADVETSQQLWYAAEHNYRVNPLENSKAEEYYNLAKELLQKLVKPTMSDYEKACKIYDYIEHTATYSYAAANLPDSEDPVNFPDDIAATYKAYYLEGFFDDKCVVCDGFAKTYTLLGKMAGLDIVRGVGTSDTRYVSKEVAGHAYCFVKIDGKYYLSCPTWGQYSLQNNKIVTSKTYLMSPENYIHPYESTMWSDFIYTTTTNYADYFKTIDITLSDDTVMDAYIESNEEAEALDLETKYLTNYYMNIYFANSTLASAYRNGSHKGRVMWEEDGLQAIIYSM